MAKKRIAQTGSIDLRYWLKLTDKADAITASLKRASASYHQQASATNPA